MPCMSRLRLLAVHALTLAACVSHAPAPEAAPSSAEGGHAPRRFDTGQACGHWKSAAGHGDKAARSHISFPELDPRSCYIKVHYGPDGPRADPIPEGCGYAGDASLLDRLRRASARYRA